MRKRMLAISILSLVMGCNGNLNQLYKTADGRGNSQNVQIDPFSTTVTGGTNIPVQQTLIDRCVARYQNYTYELREVSLPNGHRGVIAIQRTITPGDPVAQCTNGFLSGVPLNNPQFWGGMMMPYGQWGWGGYGYGGYGAFQGRMTVYKPASSGGEN